VALRFRKVTTKADWRAFLHVPREIYRGNPNWVPPLAAAQKELLDRARHPFHKHAAVEYYVAIENGRPIGRIAAIVNHRHNEVHGDRVGFFGFFEVVDDFEIARGLFRAAERHLRRAGMEIMRGPVNPSTNDECGLLVEGFDSPPVFLMPYNPPYYTSVLEGYGFRKAKDVYAYLLESVPDAPERMRRAADAIRARYGVRIRPIDARAFDRDVDALHDLYNACWEKNWGFVPMTEEEFRHLAKDLRRIADPALIPIAEIDGKPIGFALVVRDINRILIRMDGRLFPFGIFRLLFGIRRVRFIRIITLGVLPEHRNRGIESLLVKEIFDRSIERGIRDGEMSWILEDNAPMTNLLVRIGARRYKTYRFYDAPIA